MKKLIAILFALVSLTMGAQSFYKGALLTQIGYEMDIYRVHYHYNLKGTNLSYDSYDGAASQGFNLSAQYGVLKWLGLGLKYKFDSYITETDSVTGIKPQAVGFELGGLADFHVVRRERFNLSLGVDFGYSQFIFRFKDPSGTEMYGEGSWSNFHITPRYYFGRFGLNLSLHFPKITYNNMTSNDKSFNNYIFTKWQASGFGFSFGVQYRFLNDRQ